MSRFEELSAMDKLITARVMLEKDAPFFSYLVRNLKFQEKPSIPTCGVNSKGDLFFNPDWINKWDCEQLKTVLAHEVLHIIFNHLVRKGNRNHRLFNIAGDIVNNNMLIENGFEFGDLEGIIPKYNETQIKHITIQDIDKKFAEQIYAELEELIEEGGDGGDGGEENDDGEDGGSGSGEGGDGVDSGKKGNSLKDYEGFDEHILDDKETPEKEKEKNKEEWKKRLVEATTHAKNQGNLPAGMERYVEDLLDAKLNWKALLYKYITQEIMVDYSWAYPSRKSIALGTYLPSVKKENVDITIAIDTSLSIDEEELKNFLSEISGITKGFENIKLNVFCMDTEVQSHVVIQNGEIDELMKNIKGGGGTDFEEVYDYVRENIPQTKLLVFFTDGFARFPDYEEFKTLWVLTKRSVDPERIPFGATIKLEGDEE